VKTSINARVAQAMKRQGLDQAAVARAAGVSPKTVSAFLRRGPLGAQVRTIARIVMAVGMDLTLGARPAPVEKAAV
jgi:transcriptional regulator with XRE-family HTH domain